MDLKHIIPQQRRRTYGPSLDIAFSVDKSNESRVGPNPVHTRASSGTFVNQNGVIVGKTRSTTSLNPASVPVGGVAIFQVPSGSVVGWLNNSVVVVMEDTDGNDQVGAQRHITGTLIHKTDTAITLLVTSKSGTTTLSSWFVSYRGLRNDHDPVTGLCLGALIEESRTNILPRSEAFDDSTVWTQIRLVSQPIANTHIAPDGTLTAEKLTPSVTSGDHRIDRASVSGLVTGTTYTVSVFVKADGYTGFGIHLGSSPQPIGATFDLTTGTVSSTLSGWTARVQAHPNGWYRCSATFMQSTGSRLYLHAGETGTNFNYAGDETSGIVIWGSQFEIGTRESSYIPTTAIGVVRSADVYNITNTAPFWNSSEFTLLTKANFLSSGVDAYASNFNITSGFFGVRRPNTNQAVGIIRSSGVNADIPFGANGSFTTGSMRMALAHSTGQQAGSLNGAVAIQQNSAFAPTSNPIFNIGSSNTSASSAINGHIASIKYFRNRLPNVQLQALTAITSEPIVYNGVAIWYNGVGIIETN